MANGNPFMVDTFGAPEMAQALQLQAHFQQLAQARVQSDREYQLRKQIHDDAEREREMKHQAAGVLGKGLSELSGYKPPSPGTSPIGGSIGASAMAGLDPVSAMMMGAVNGAATPGISPHLAGMAQAAQAGLAPADPRYAALEAQGSAAMNAANAAGGPPGAGMGSTPMALAALQAAGAPPAPMPIAAAPPAGYDLGAPEMTTPPTPAQGLSPEEFAHLARLDPAHAFEMAKLYHAKTGMENKAATDAAKQEVAKLKVDNAQELGKYKADITYQAAHEKTMEKWDADSKRYDAAMAKLRARRGTSSKMSLKELQLFQAQGHDGIMLGRDFSAQADKVDAELSRLKDTKQVITEDLMGEKKVTTKTVGDPAEIAAKEKQAKELHELSAAYTAKGAQVYNEAQQHMTVLHRPATGAPKLSPGRKLAADRKAGRVTAAQAEQQYNALSPAEQNAYHGD